VVALIEGAETPEEIFVYAAHWDHLGTNPEIDGDGIYNGAIDNATGTAALLELARVYMASEKAPRRSVLFLALAAEEQGLLGSKFYASQPLFPFNKTVAGINIDSMSIVGKARDVIVVGHGQSELDNYLTEFAALQNRIVKPDPRPERGSYYRSDHFEFARMGVPMLFAKGGQDHLEKGVEFGKALADDYSSNRYHQPGDEYSEDWDLSGAMQDMELYYQIGKRIADSEDWPRWSDSSEFKSYR
jgi:Zn-dependent M28 family amino/carboxypeptidase